MSTFCSEIFLPSIRRDWAFSFSPTLNIFLLSLKDSQDRRTSWDNSQGLKVMGVPTSPSALGDYGKWPELTLREHTCPILTFSHLILWLLGAVSVAALLADKLQALPQCLSVKGRLQWRAPPPTSSKTEGSHVKYIIRQGIKAVVYVSTACYQEHIFKSELSPSPFFLLISNLQTIKFMVSEYEIHQF